MNRIFIRCLGTIFAITYGIIAKVNATPCNLHPSSQLRYDKYISADRGKIKYTPGCYSNNEYVFLIPYGALPEHNFCGDTSDDSGSGSGSVSGTELEIPSGITGDCNSGAAWSQHCTTGNAETGTYYCLDDGDFSNKYSCGPKGYITGALCTTEGIMITSGMLQKYFSAGVSGINDYFIAEKNYSNPGAIPGGDKQVYWWPYCYNPSDQSFYAYNCAQYFDCVIDNYYSTLKYGQITDRQIDPCAICPTYTDATNIEYSTTSGTAGITSCLVSFSKSDNSGNYTIKNCPYEE